MSDDWFRCADWSAEAQHDFEARLARARPYNRAQYMRIKGLARDSYVRENTATAEDYYRRLLAQHPLNRTSHTVEISLAELLGRGDRASMEEALALISIAQATGEKETVQRAARTALDLASRGPVFPRHKDVGVVDADAKTPRRLRKLAK